MTRHKVKFFVPGVPAPGGSKRVFYNKKTGRAIVTDDCKRNKDWRALVVMAARQHCRVALEGPLALSITFYMPRPKAHYGANGVKLTAPSFHTVKPDATKLLRSTEDALSDAGVWRDDAQVAIQRVIKLYTNAVRTGAEIVIEQL